MQAAVCRAVAGAVQVSDGVGYSDRSLILRTCDGRGVCAAVAPATAAFHRSPGVGDGPLAKYPNVLPITTTHTPSAAGSGPIFL